MAGFLEKLRKPAEELTLTFPEGNLIFSQGDKGGDIYFIEEGIIDIFVIKDNMEIPVAEMKKGEILGLMTFLTAENRLASARAQTAVKVRKISHQKIKKIIDAFPQWLHTVLKEFTLRIGEMNRRYSDAVILTRKLKSTQVTKLFKATQVSTASGVISEGLGIDAGLVVHSKLVEKSVQALGFTKAEVESVLDIFVEAGMMLVEFNPKDKQKALKFESLQKLSYFSEFVTKVQKGELRNLMKANLSSKDIKVLSSIVRFVAKQGVSTAQMQKVSIQGLRAEVEKECACKIDDLMLERVSKLELLQFERKDGDLTVSFKPLELGRTLACLTAYNKLADKKEDARKAA